MVWTVVEIKYTTSPAGKQVIHDVQSKIERLRVPADVSVEPVLVSAKGATSAVERSAFFYHILTLPELLM